MILFQVKFQRQAASQKLHNAECGVYTIFRQFHEYDILSTLFDVIANYIIAVETHDRISLLFILEWRSNYYVTTLKTTAISSASVQ